MKRANGTGTVYKLSGRRRKPWAVAKNKIMIGYYATKKEALRALDAYLNEDISPSFNMTFKDVYEAWASEHFREITVPSQKGYKFAYKHLPSLYNKKFRELKTRDLQKAVDMHPTQTYSQIFKFKNLLLQMYEWAMREQIVATNLAHFIILPKKEMKKEKEIFTQAEIDEIIKYAKKENSLDGIIAKLTVILLYTGMRIGELLNLKTKNCFDDYVIGGEKTEAGKERLIPIGKPALKFYSDFLSEARKNNSENFCPIRERGFRNHYIKFLDELEIPYRVPHTTRHTFASMARENGMPPEILQKILGHTSYTITADIYVHKTVDDLISAVQNIK